LLFLKIRLNRTRNLVLLLIFLSQHYLNRFI
jgi:hypothetical protein